MATGEIRALLFDFGNTLAFLDYEALAEEFRAVLPALDAVALERAEYVGRQALDDYVMNARPLDLDKAYELYFRAWMAAAGIPPSRIDWCRERFMALNQAESLWRVVRPGITDHLQQFRDAGFRLGVVSNALGNIEADAARYGLADYFDVIIDSHVVGVAKPDPRIFHIALERMRIAPGEALFAGDLYSIDMVGALAAGLRGCKLIDVMDNYSWVDHVRIRGIHELPHR
ncbi:MAG TPA: HAD family hydrolase [Candidatus Binataceae bacterium]|nr:HAD family hydrolase [Candidatus Binataceae bacterium]